MMSYFIASLLIFFIAVSGAYSEENPSTTTELKELSLDALMEVEITSVSKRSEKLLDAPASIYVITSEDIRRSGANSLPEVLRLAPNLQVAQVDPVQYAISARGFNNAVGNKLLVLIDGRTVYTPLFSGVFWEQQIVMLQDIDRIEVISGPGATLWGANAVNGVINVITKSSADTQRALAVGELGNNRAASFRYGGKAGSQSTYRVYGMADHWDNFQNSAGVEQLNEWGRIQAGFRFDHTNSTDAWTLQGDIYDGQSEHRGFIQTLELPEVTISGGNVLARWTRHLSDSSELQLQTYYDHAHRDDFIFFRPESDIFDIEVQHHWSHSSHQIVWGGGYRHAWDNVETGLLFKFIPPSRKLDWGNVFVQDEIRLNSQLAVTLGIKLEHNEYSGLEYLPSARLAWKPSTKQLLWTAISRAVRAPSRLDREIFFPVSPPFIVAGGPNFQSEVAKVYEVGFRSYTTSKFGYSITGYAHDWDKLRSGTSVPVLLENKIRGWVYGLEAWGNYQLPKMCSIRGGLTLLREDLELEEGSTDPVGVNNPQLRNDPDYQWMVGSTCNLTRDVEFDLHLRGIDSLSIPPSPGYKDLTLRLGWRISKNVELSFIGQNLLHERHPEFGAIQSRTEPERSVFGRIIWNF